MTAEIHTPDLKTEVKNEPFGTAKYWKLRCNYLEKSHDPTYSVEERSQCHFLYVLLVTKEK